MKFGKLLAAGKSWMNGRTEVSYRVNKQVYLPKFESPKNPFANPAKAKAENPTPEKKEIAAAKVEKNEKAPVNYSGAGILPAKDRLEACPTKPSWASKLNPISIFRPSPEMKSARPAVQEELSLDSVKVVHNDLSDADVEVVPIKSRSMPADLQPARKSWEILGERILKATAL